MGPDFVRAYAPIFAVDRADGPPAAGIGVSEEIDAATGLPAPFIQSGGVREYFGVGPDGLRGRAAPTLTPSIPAPTDDGLRGTTDPSYFLDEGGFPMNYYREQGSAPQFFPQQQYPGALGRQPEGPPPIEQQRRTPGMAPRVGIPPQVEEYPPNRQVPLQPEDPPSIEQQRRTPGMAPRVGIPGANRERILDNPSQSDLDFSSSAPQDLLRGRERRSVRDPSRSRTPSVRDAHPMRSALPFGGNDQRMDTDTLGSLIARYTNYVFPRDDGNAGPVASASIPRNPNNPRALLGGYPDLSTDEGLADFNRRMGVNFGRQLRTRQEQDALIARGATRARNSAHLTGDAFDWSARQLEGRTGREAEQYVRQRLQSAGYPVDSMRIIWESGRGRNQGTGAHVHVEWRE